MVSSNLVKVFPSSRARRALSPVRQLGATIPKLYPDGMADALARRKVDRNHGASTQILATTTRLTMRVCLARRRKAWASRLALSLIFLLGSAIDQGVWPVVTAVVAVVVVAAVVVVVVVFSSFSLLPLWDHPRSLSVQKRRKIFISRL